MDNNRPKLVGIIPAAGNASRISPIPCSKEIFPIGFQTNSGNPQLRVASSYLFESFCEAGAKQIYMIIRKGKWDIPEYLGIGKKYEYSLAYLVTDPTKGTHHTIDLAHEFIKDRTVLLGFPDILFTPRNAFVSLLEKQKQTSAEIVLGLYKTRNHRKADMVDFDDQGRVRNIVIKPDQTQLAYAWTIAVWTPAFTEFLHETVVDLGNGKRSISGQKGEIFIGDVIQAAIKQGMNVQTVLFPDEKFLDIGTIADLKSVLNNSWSA